MYDASLHYNLTIFNISLVTPGVNFFFPLSNFVMHTMCFETKVSHCSLDIPPELWQILQTRNLPKDWINWMRDSTGLYSNILHEKIKLSVCTVFPGLILDIVDLNVEPPQEVSYEMKRMRSVLSFLNKTFPLPVFELIKLLAKYRHTCIVCFDNLIFLFSS